jgi:hypothetical protein
VIQTYLLPYDPANPVVCFDEACKQLFGEVREPLPTRPGSPAKQDYEYERKGVCHQLLMCEPLRGWRHVKVTERRTRRDYAECVRELVDVSYPDVEKIRLVQDNLNTQGAIAPAPRITRLFRPFPPRTLDNPPVRHRSSIASTIDTLRARPHSNGAPGGPRSVVPPPHSRSSPTVSAAA